MKPSEKRRHQRKMTHNSTFPIVWFVVHEDMSTSAEMQAAVTDISASGVGLHTEVALEPGQKIKFTKKETIDMLAEAGTVMWTTESRDGYKAGVMFG